MRLGKVTIIVSIISALFLGAISFMVISLQEYESISKGTILYHLLVDGRFKNIELESNYDFKYIPADGTSPEIHILRVYITQSLEDEVRFVNDYFKNLGFIEVNDGLQKGRDVLIFEKDLDNNLVVFSLYIY